MALQETIFQNWLFKDFILPFLLIFTISFAVLEKTKLLGDDRHQINAIVSFTIGLMFISVLYPKDVVNNLILFLTVALVVVFIFLLLWGFVSTNKQEGFQLESWMKWSLWIAIGVTVTIAVLWASGASGGVYDLLFRQPWSSSFWTNFFFILIVAGALALVLKKK